MRNHMENIKTYMQQVGQQARAASRIMAQADTAAKNRALEEIAKTILNSSAALIAANAKDVAAARDNGLDESGYRVISNCGANSGQEVPHLHLHLLGGKPLGRLVE